MAPIAGAGIDQPPDAATDAIVEAETVATETGLPVLRQVVKVANLPATQPVSGTVSVSNLPATQPVSGPLTDAQLRAVPLPVSATALPLPTGAATTSDVQAVRDRIPVPTLSSRMLNKQPQSGYRIWFDTANASYLYMAEALIGANPASGGAFAGVRIPLDANGNPVGAVEENASFNWNLRTTAGGWT